MTRPLRVEHPDALYRVISRGNRRKVIFHGEADRRTFLDT